MTKKWNTRDLAWVGGGLVVLVGVTLLVLHYNRALDLASRSASRVDRMEQVARLRVALSTASEAEKCAVMATTDEESRRFADQSRAASAGARQARDELGRLLAGNGTDEQREILVRISEALANCGKIDDELLALAVENSNLKANDLAFGPATDAAMAMDDALRNILDTAGNATNGNARQVMLRAADARAGVLRTLALLAPHIAEKSDAKMDEFDARIAAQDQDVRGDLKALASLLGSRNRNVEAAAAQFDVFLEVKGRIVALSRQNTNVRSLLTSINEKTAAVQACQGALDDLERAIAAEAAEQAPTYAR